MHASIPYCIYIVILLPLEVYCKGIILWYHIQVVLFIQYYTSYKVVIVQQSTCCLSVMCECSATLKNDPGTMITIIPGRPHACTNRSKTGQTGFSGAVLYRTSGD